MGGDLAEMTFDELIRAGLLEIGDGYRAKNDELGGSGPIFLRAGHVTDTHIDFVGVERFHAHLAGRVTSKLSEPGDTIVTTKGNSTGRTGYVSVAAPQFVYSPHLCFWRSKRPDTLAPLFLRYWARSPEFVRQLKGMQGSTDMAPYLSLTDQRRLRISLPDPKLQHAIGSILGSLDDKIELNRKMNATLEAMARALFKSWFVDFDPVRAKAEGRAPSGMDAETAKLFPSELVESELGPIPMGWQVCKLGELLELKRGYDLPAAQRLPGRVPIVSSSGPTGVHDEAKVVGPGLVTGRYGTIGRVFLVREDFWPLNTTLYVRDLKRTHLHFAYHLLCALDFEKFSDKAAVPGINRNHVHEEQVVAAPHEVQRRFEEVAGPWGRECERRATESRILARIRDELLPRLLSGAVSVASAEREAEAVA